MKDSFRSGFVSLTGAPNVGKSTILNVILGQKISIVTEKPQTTRNRILGIKTYEDAQIVFVDTPGIHSPRHMLGEKMVKAAKEALKEIDLVIFITEPGRNINRDQAIIDLLRNLARPVILVINKIDRVKKKDILLMIDDYMKLHVFKELIPVSAIKKDGMDILIKNILKYLPPGPKYYPDELITDQMERSMAAEIIREKIMEKTSEEIPYSAAVEVMKWTDRKDGVILISANIYVEREGQKGIIIGNKGEKLKSIGIAARNDIESLLNTKVFLELWVKVKKGWRDNKKFLDELGYG
ncbi:MAG: GTPase Era [Nitrospirota bacterium]